MFDILIPDKGLQTTFGLIHIYKCKVYGFPKDNSRTIGLADYMQRTICNNKSIFFKYLYPHTFTFLYRFLDEGIRLDKNNFGPLVPYFISSGNRKVVTGKYNEILFLPRSIYDRVHNNQPFIENIWDIDDNKWLLRENKIIFRGRNTNKLRSKLSLLTNKYPNYVDIKLLCENQNEWNDNNTVCANGHINYTNQMKYRYILNIDGHTIADRLSGLFRLGNIIIKYENENINEQDLVYWYYHLQKNIHYLSFTNITELENIIENIIVKSNEINFLRNMFKIGVNGKLNSIKYYNSHVHNCFVFNMLHFYRLMIQTYI